MELKDLVVDSYILTERVKLERMPHSRGVRWAIRNRFGEVLGKDGWWMEEPAPSNRDDGFYKNYRYDTAEEALKFWEEYTGKDHE